MPRPMSTWLSKSYLKQVFRDHVERGVLHRGVAVFAVDHHVLVEESRVVLAGELRVAQDAEVARIEVFLADGQLAADRLDLLVQTREADVLQSVSPLLHQLGTRLDHSLFFVPLFSIHEERALAGPVFFQEEVDDAVQCEDEVLVVAELAVFHQRGGLSRESLDESIDERQAGDVCLCSSVDDGEDSLERVEQSVLFVVELSEVCREELFELAGEHQADSSRSDLKAVAGKEFLAAEQQSADVVRLHRVS